jgi:hypothetical protein
MKQLMTGEGAYVLNGRMSLSVRQEARPLFARWRAVAMFDPNAEMPSSIEGWSTSEPVSSLEYAPARGKQVNVRVIPSTNAIDKSRTCAWIMVRVPIRLHVLSSFSDRNREKDESRPIAEALG